MGEKRKNDEVRELLTAALEAIRKRLGTYYWNQNQKQIDDPFGNTGAKWENGTFSAAAYDWSEEGNTEPNFQYEDLKVWWYKYLGRGMAWELEDGRELTPDDISCMLYECLLSLPLNK